MDKTVISDNETTGVEQLLGETLAQEEAALVSAGPVLKHLLSGSSHLLLSEQIVARVNAMVRGLARQLLFALAEAVETSSQTGAQFSANLTDREAFAEFRLADLAKRLSDDADMLAHLHTLAAEDMANSKVQLATNHDPVLSPLLQELAGSADEDVADKAMGVVAAQARFIQQQSRMELPLAQLPGDQFHTALLALAEVAEDNLAALDITVRNLRAVYDEGDTRLGRITNLLMRLGEDAKSADAKSVDEGVMDLDFAGLALFSSAISLACGQERSRVIMAFSYGQSSRFALCLRAAGMDQNRLERHFFAVHPDSDIPDGFADIDAARAASMLASSHQVGGR